MSLQPASKQILQSSVDELWQILRTSSVFHELSLNEANFKSLNLNGAILSLCFTQTDYGRQFNGHELRDYLYRTGMLGWRDLWIITRAVQNMVEEDLKRQMAPDVKVMEAAKQIELVMPLSETERREIEEKVFETKRKWREFEEAVKKMQD